MADVSVQSATKSFGATTVLNAVSLDIDDGEFVVLVGPSGCGKSTLLKMIAGLEDVSDGTIAIGQQVVNAVPPKHRDIAMVFQSYALYPHMSVKENMGFALSLRRVAKQTIAEKVGQVAETLGLNALLERRPRQLSGGQRQRVAMGRALVRAPQVFLFDEPLSNLDAKLRVQMRAEIKALHQRLQTTTIYVTHDQIEAMTMADKVVVMRDGRIEQIGPPLDIYDRPANVFVAGFLGSPSMNLFAGRSEDSGFVLGDGVVLRTMRHVAGATTLGVRPEHIALAETGVPFVVEVVEPTGAETLVVGTLAGQNATAVFRERFAAKPGSTLTISIDSAAMHLFHADGNRV